MIQIPEHILSLIEKQLKGNPGEAEAQQLQQWRSENRLHEVVYRQLEKIWIESGSILHETVYDEEAAWYKVEQRLAQTRNRHTIRLVTRLAMAACMAGVLFFAAWLFYHQPTPSLQLATAQQANMPVTLPDGSQIVLRKGATLYYPKAFSGATREVTLTGEAWFEVQHNASHPFRIQTKRATMEVLGTTFSINTTSAQDELIVATGKVLFTNKAATAEKHIVYPNQYGVLTQKGFAIQPLHDPNFLAWKTGILKFSNTPIDQVAATLSNYYGLPVQTDSLLMKLPVTPTITATFNKQSVDSVLDEIKLLVNIGHRKQNDTIVLFKQ
jgi:ferric-dicitrate binding protein FerR (iron transport regulator)